MLHSLALIVIALSIIVILLFAYMKKDKLARFVAFTILAAIALGMALNGLANLISDIDFLSFIVSFFRFLADIVIFIELAIILFLVFLSKFKTKIMFLKIAIIVYVILKLLIEFNIFN